MPGFDGVIAMVDANVHGFAHPFWLVVENLKFLLVKSLESIVLSQLVKYWGGECERGESGKPPRPFSRSGSKKGRTTPLYFEGLKLTHLGLSSIYLYICRKLLQFRQREKRVVNAKKRSSQPEKSGENSALADFAAVCCLDIYGKTVFRILLQKARKPA